MTRLTAEDLLRGGQTTHEIELPRHIVDTVTSDASDADSIGDGAISGTIVIRPLVLADIQRIQKAGAASEALTSVLMVQQALVEPALTVDQVNRLHAGLVQYILDHVNRASGLGISDDELTEAVQAPLARACFTLSREFGWTPDECSDLTIGQVLLYLEMIGKGEQWKAVA